MQPLKLIPTNIPTALREIDSWLCWKLRESKNSAGDTIWLKVPYYSDGTKRRGVVGSEADVSKLVSFRDALNAYKKGGYSGIGFAPMAEHTLTILDLDKCIDDDGNLSEFARAVVESGTYVEKSPSGRGLRAVYSGGALCPGEKKNDFLDNGERVEIYCGRAYVTITGQRLEQAAEQAGKMPKSIKKTLEPIVKGSGVSRSAQPTRIEGDVLISPDAAPLPGFTAGHAKALLRRLPGTWGEPGTGTWYRVAAALHLQFDGAEEAYQVLDEWSHTLDGYDEDANRKRWDAGFSHASGREGVTTMRNLVFEAVENGKPPKRETMIQWGLARSEEEDFSEGETEAVLPEYGDLREMADIWGMVNNKAEPVEWLIDNLIPRGTVSFLAGGSGTSKSYLTMQLCAAAAIGMKEFADMGIVAGGFRSLYFAFEDGRKSLHVRVQEVLQWVYSLAKAEQNEVLGTNTEDYEEEDDQIDEVLMNRVKHALRDQMGILPSEVLDSGAFMIAKSKKRFEPMEVTKLLPYMQDYVQTNFVDLVVIDTGSEIHTGDENSAADMVVLMRALRLLASSTNCAVLVVQHVSKGIWGLSYDEINQASIRGSSVLVDKSRNVVMLARMPRKDAYRFGLPNTNDTHDDYVVLKHVKANLGGYTQPKVFLRTSKGRLKYEAQYVLDDNRPEPVDNDAETNHSRRLRNNNNETRRLIMEFLESQPANLSATERPAMPRVQAAMSDHMSTQTCTTQLDWLVLHGYVSAIKDSARKTATKRFSFKRKWDGNPGIDDTPADPLD